MTKSVFGSFIVQFDIGSERGREINKEHWKYSIFKDLAQEYWQKGAEYGYNKANEWHYVKDGEYPIHSNRVLVFTDEDVGFGIYGHDNKKMVHIRYRI